MNSQKVARLLPALPLIVVGFMCLIFPIGMLVYTALQTSDGIGFDNFVAVLTNPMDLQAIFNSLQFAFWQAVLCIVLGTPIALALLKLPARQRGTTMSVINVASNFGGPGLAFAFLLLIGSNGVLTLIWSQLFGPTEFPSLGSMLGLNLIMLYVHLPLYLLLALPSYSIVRDELRDAARMSGAGKWRYWTRVVIPILAPFVLGHGFQVFMWSVGSYSVPYVVTQSPSAIDLISVEIGLGLQGGVFGLERPATLAVLLIIQAVGLVWIYRTLQRRGEKLA